MQHKCHTFENIIEQAGITFNREYLSQKKGVEDIRKDVEIPADVEEKLKEQEREEKEEIERYERGEEPENCDEPVNTVIMA